MPDRKFLVIGLGSMGKRRVRCLQFLGHYDIVGYDIRPDRLQEAQTRYGIATVADLDALDLDAITHVIISTPPDAHLGYASQMHAIGKHIFIEASVVHDGYADLAAALPGRANVLAPSCTMRFDPLNRRVKAWLEEGVIGDGLFCQHHFGMYLPKWHPYESISDFYVSKTETGAGREIVPFDLVYLSWFFGLPQDIRGHIDRTGHIDAPIDDVYALTFRTPRCRTVQMTIDVVSQVPYRTTRIVGTKGNIEIDTVKGTLALYTEPTQSWRLLTRAQLAETTAAEEMYVTEINCFLDAAAGRAPFPYTLDEDWAVLKALYEAERGIAGPAS